MERAKFWQEMEVLINDMMENDIWFDTWNDTVHSIKSIDFARRGIELTFTDGTTLWRKGDKTDPKHKILRAV